MVRPNPTGTGACSLGRNEIFFRKQKKHHFQWFVPLTRERSRNSQENFSGHAADSDSTEKEIHCEDYCDTRKRECPIQVLLDYAYTSMSPLFKPNETLRLIEVQSAFRVFVILVSQSD
jgi:hypothetical protein